jgi:methylated-DNA-protein-cysteine methyltransferase related protein
MRKSSFLRRPTPRSVAADGRPSDPRRGARLSRGEGSRYAPFTLRAVAIIRAIPRGKVATYGQVAGVAGSPSGARQVARVLHSLSRAKRLPWQRVINSRGFISLPRGGGFERQKALLESEGVVVSRGGRIDMKRYLWVPRF